MKWTYESTTGKIVNKAVLSTRLFSRVLYGLRCNSAWSVRGIEPFVRNFQIDMSEFEETSYRTFNEFFIRKFKKEVRQFDSRTHLLPAFAEGKYLGYATSAGDSRFPIKQMNLSPREVLGKVGGCFEGGPVLICRLGPMDYHRFHFPDDGRVVERFRVHGPLNPTNPICYRYRDDIFVLNERQVSLLETRHFGLLGYVEVGATCVGRIVNSYKREEFRRGDEKGYFLVGGSTVIVFGQKGTWLPENGILERSSRGIETRVHLGEPVAQLTHY